MSLSGYDKIFALTEINEDKILEIQQHINGEKIVLFKDMVCSHAGYYTNQEVFKFLPGHSSILLALSKVAREYLKNRFSIKSEESNHAYPLLHEMIKTAEYNNFKDKHNASYSDVIRYFSTYIFLLCGRSCYEMLRMNLPLPSVKTACTYA